MKIAFDKIYDSYHQDLYRFIFYMVKNKEVTEDLLQEVYIKILKSYESFEGKSSQKTWLFSIARHTTIDYFRSQKRKRSHILNLFDWSEKGDYIPDENPLPEELVMKSERERQIYSFLDQCTVDQKSVLILRFIQSFSIKETAEILNFSESKVKTTQHRGLKKLRELLDHKEGGDLL